MKIYGRLGFGFLEEVHMAHPPTGSAPGESPDEQPRPEMDKPAWADESPLGRDARVDALDAIARRVAACQECRLCHSRTNVVPGEGDPMAQLMFIGEGPGANEDIQGRPFVGRAGELLTKIIEAMQFRREEVWIGNVVKCRPPGNRQPEPDEMETCLPFLREQVAIVRPKVIVTLGKTALAGLLPQYRREPMSKVRGQWLSCEGVPLMPTFHPAYLLRSPSQKKLVWEDMQAVMKEFGKAPPGR